MVDSIGGTHTSLVVSKTKVAPIRHLTTFGVMWNSSTSSNTSYLQGSLITQGCIRVDSMIVLNWLTGSPRRLKTYVSNHVSSIMELIAPDCWSHVNGLKNPADCASRGSFPLELLTFLWWDGSKQLQLLPDEWPKQCTLPPNTRKQ